MVIALHCIPQLLPALFYLLESIRLKKPNSMIVLDSNFWSIIFNAHKIIEVGGLLLVLAIIYIELLFSWICSARR